MNKSKNVPVRTAARKLNLSNRRVRQLLDAGQLDEYIPDIEYGIENPPRFVVAESLEREISRREEEA